MQRDAYDGTLARTGPREYSQRCIGKRAAKLSTIAGKRASPLAKTRFKEAQYARAASCSSSATHTKKMASAGIKLLKGRPKAGIAINKPPAMIVSPLICRPLSPVTQ